MIHAKGVCSATLISSFASSVNYDRIEHNLEDFRISQVTPIAFQKDHEHQLMSSFHYKTRNMIRKARKNDIHVKVENTCFPFLMETHFENFRALGGKAKPSRFFASVERFFEKDIDYKIYVAEKNGIAVAALLLFYYKGYVEYYTPVVKQEYRHLQPLSLIILHAMTDASKAGYSWWNWGGTWPNQDGVYRFKKRFAAQEAKYTYYTFLKNKNVLKQSCSDLLEWYVDFFVLPFNALESQK
jgi:lipid II:glycine glycyltransferase (peptidoglycan interpeptide bridge formation enzyme)